MKLIDYLNVFVVEHETGVADNTVCCFYRPAITLFRRHLNREPLLEDLTDENLNAFSQVALAKKSNLTTLKQRRNALLALWRAAVASDRVTIGPRKIRKIPKVHLIIEAWTVDELQQLITTIRACRLKMPKSVLDRAAYLESLVRAGYESGLRLGDLLSLERGWIRMGTDGAGYVTVVQSKTGQQKTSRLEPETMQLIDRLMAQEKKRRLIWALNVERKCFYKIWRSTVAAAGIRRGTFRWIRRSGTTHVESANPGCGHRHAGHMDSRVTARHYLDRSQLQALVVSPAPLLSQ